LDLLFLQRHPGVPASVVAFLGYGPRICASLQPAFGGDDHHRCEVLEALGARF
jgi:hypothetical protein